MPLTVGVNSYGTNAEAIAIAQESGVDGAAFVALPDATAQENAMATSARAIDAVPYDGVRASPTQSQAVPRVGVRQSAAEQLAIMKMAQMLYAMYIAPSFAVGATVSLVNPELAANGNIKRKQIDVLETEYFAPGTAKPGALDRFPPNVRDLLSQLIGQRQAAYFGQGNARRVS